MGFTDRRAQKWLRLCVDQRKRSRRISKKDHWVVSVAEHGDLNFFEFFEPKIKQFKDLEKAVEYAHMNYLKWLKKRLEECKQKPINV